MKDLYIIDVSSVLYTTPEESSKVNGVEINGLLKLFRYIALTLGADDDLILAYDNGSFRKKLLPSYKEGRPHSPHVEAQKRLSFELLDRSGFKTNKIKEMEADDIANWAVNQNLGKYVDINVITNDMDLAHNVQTGVHLKSIRNDVSSVTIMNFSKALSTGTMHVPFNTISASKVFCGCTSDKILTFRTEDGRTGSKLFKEYLEWVEKVPNRFDHKVITSKKLIAYFIMGNSTFTDADKKGLMTRVLLVYPADCPGYEVKVTSASNVDRKKFSQILTMCRDYDSLKCMGYSRETASGDLYDVFTSMYKRIESGEFSVDNNLPIIKEYDLPSSGQLDLNFIKSFD